MRTPPLTVCHAFVCVRIPVRVCVCVRVCVHHNLEDVEIRDVCGAYEVLPGRATELALDLKLRVSHNKLGEGDGFLDL